MPFHLLYEYETYMDEDPRHAWYLVGTFQTKKEAEDKALDVNFAEFCEDKIFRWGAGKPSKTTNLSAKEKLNIVSKVLKNINMKTGSRNEYFGKGAFILSSNDFNPKNNVKHIDDIAVYLNKEAREDYEAKCKEFDEEEEPSDDEYDEPLPTARKSGKREEEEYVPPPPEEVEKKKEVKVKDIKDEDDTEEYYSED